MSKMGPWSSARNSDEQHVPPTLQHLQTQCFRRVTVWVASCVPESTLHPALVCFPLAVWLSAVSLIVSSCAQSPLTPLVCVPCLFVGLLSMSVNRFDSLRYLSFTWVKKQLRLSPAVSHSQTSLWHLLYHPHLPGFHQTSNVQINTLWRVFQLAYRGIKHQFSMDSLPKQKEWDTFAKWFDMSPTECIRWLPVTVWLMALNTKDTGWEEGGSWGERSVKRREGYLDGFGGMVRRHLNWWSMARGGARKWQIGCHTNITAGLRPDLLCFISITVLGL